MKITEKNNYRPFFDDISVHGADFDVAFSSLFCGYSKDW